LDHLVLEPVCLINKVNIRLGPEHFGFNLVVINYDGVCMYRVKYKRREREKNNTWELSWFAKLGYFQSPHFVWDYPL